ncbi:MAG: DUF3179 domain-containing (seleno)protein [Dehalococcoidia bacterium]
MRRRLAASLPVLVLGLALAACAAPAPTATPTSTATPTEAAAGPEPSTTATPAPLTAAEVTSMLRQAVCWYEDAASAADCLPPSDEVRAVIASMGTSEDDRFVAPLVDMRYLDVGWRRAVDDALEALTGERFEQGIEWYRWLVTARPRLPEGYVEWKGHLLAFADPAFEALLGTEASGALRPDLLIWTGTASGELPALEAPPTTHASLQAYLDANDVVYSLQVGDVARAYPRRIVAWHGIVQDDLEGARVLVTFCGPCGGASAFAPVAGGQQLTFHDAGLAYDGHRLIADAETGSLWEPFSGRAVWGPLAAKGTSLPRIAIHASTWGRWAAEHQNSSVLTLDTGFVRDYTEGAWSTLGGTPAMPRFPLVEEVDDRLATDAEVVGLVVGASARAYPVDEIRNRRIVHDQLGGASIVLLADGADAPIRAFASGPLTVATLNAGMTADGEDGLEGDRWFVLERALVSTLDGREYPSIATAQGSWLAWSRAYPATSIFGLE